MNSSNLRRNPATISAPVQNLYAHSVEVPAGSRQLYVAGQVGTRLDGTIAPDLPGQVEQIMANIKAILAEAGMTFADIVKINAYCLKPEDIFTYAEIRNRHLAGSPPATTAVVVAALARAEWLVEVDAIAAKKD
jgi:enamine deaminase RidA (YjgF/YER057c/UK114 family)